jgi:predicted permease
MNPLGIEIRHVTRRLLRSPGFTAISVLTLALGIGANTAIFSVVNGVLLRPLPFSDAGELVGLWHSAPGIGIPEFEQSNTTYTMYEERNRSFVDVGLSNPFTFNLTGGGDPVRVASASATSSLFRVLRVSPGLGRGFTEEDDQFGAEDVVILSNDLWKTRFGSDPNILDRAITLDGNPYTVVGVMPAGFTYPGEETRLWIPHRIDPATLGEVSFSYEAIARLRPGVTIEVAAADLNRMLWEIPEVYPGELTRGLMENAQLSAHINPMHEDVVGDIDQVLWVLLGTVGFLLLIACANVANLFLVRAEARQKEIVIRTALGASRGDVVKYFLGESLGLALVGGLVGLGLAFIGIRVLTGGIPIPIPRLGEVGMHGMVLSFTAGVSILAGFVFGAVPIFRYASPNLVTSLKEGGRGSSTGRETHRARNLLVVSQVALALVLLVGSGLMARSFWALRSVHPGFNADNVLTFHVSVPPSEYPERESVVAFYRELFEKLGGLPGVTQVGAARYLPMTDGQTNNGTMIEDFPLQEDEVPPIIRTSWAGPGYFEAIGMSLREGRFFENADEDQPARSSVIVSEGFADRFWPGQSALGKRVTQGLGADDDTGWYTIVGVVGDVRDDGLAQDPPAMIYFPTVPNADSEYQWTARRTMSVAIATAVDPMSLAAAARQAVWSIDRRIPVANVRPTQEIVADSMARTSFTMLLLGIAAGVALLLGTVGIYGVISYVVSQRTQEIGVRMALGAKRQTVSLMVVRQGLLISSIGVGVGLVAAFGLTRLMGALLFGVSATDALTFGVLAVFLLVVAVVACLIPARRAAGVHPVEALRYE